MRDYSRQQIFDMQKIGNAKITVVGREMLSSYLCLYMAGLGIKKLRIVEQGDEGIFKGLEETLTRINSEMEIKTRNNLDEMSIGRPDVLVEFTNDRKIKEHCEGYAKRYGIQLVNGATDEDNGSLYMNEGNFDKNLSMYEGRKQGTFTSGIIAAIALDEIRKIIMPIEGDNKLRKRIDFSMNKKNRFNEGIETRQNNGSAKKLKALVAGAGGIGTYNAMNLALMSIGEIDIMDGDKIEENNLNRQVLYYGRVGENKAKALSERLREITKSEINGIPYYFKDMSQLRKKYDIVLSCLDNWQGRFKLNEYALRSRACFINGAVTTFTAHTEFSTCLECKHDKEELTRKEKNEKRGSCNSLNSNVVMQNALAGALMASEAKAIANPQRYAALKRKGIEYNSRNADERKIVVLDEKTRCRCNGNGGCPCHDRR